MIAIFRNTVSFAIAATATVLIVAGSAAPVSASQVPTTVISVSGIDLASPAGVARVQAEVKRTARRLCDTGDSRSLAGQQHSRTCTQTALAAALPQLETLAATARASRTAMADATLPTRR